MFGPGNNEPYAIASIFDWNEGTWTRLPWSGWKTKQGSSCLLWKDKVIIVGGFDIIAGSYLKEVWFLDPTDFSFSRGPDLPHLFSYGDIIEDPFSGSAFIMGGRGTSDNSGDIMKLENTSSAWIEYKNALEFPRQDFQIMVPSNLWTEHCRKIEA